MRTQYLAILSFIFLLFSTSVFAGNYSWTGTTSTNWATSTNWNPNGVPTTNDTVTIVTQTNQPLLAANTTVMNFTMTSGTLNCNGYTFTVSATSSFNGGTINNGTVTCSGTSTLTFAGTTFGAVVNATGNSLLLNGSRFNSTFTAVKKGTSNDNGNGGNYFSGAVTITDSSSGNLVLSNTSAPDTFNSTLTLAARSTGSIYIAHQGTGNRFNGNVTFSTGNIYSNTYGTATYNGNITVNSTSSNIYFGNSTGNATLSSGKVISIGTFSAGTLTIRNLTQNDSTVSITLPLTGTATLTLGSGNTFWAKLKASSNALRLDGSRFFGVDTFVYLGGSATSTGLNYFGNSVYFKTTASSAISPFKVGGGGTDTFATTATFVATSTGTMNVWRSVFMGQTYFKNETTTQTTTISTLGCIFKGNLTVESANGGIEFLKFPVSPQNNSILDSTATFTVSTGYKGLLHLKEFEQRGNNAMNLQMPQITSSNLLKIGPGATFNADFTFKGNRVFLNGGIFNGNASFTRTCPNVGDIGEGGNIFNGTTLICDSANAGATRFFKMATLNPDIYNGNVKFKQYATGPAASTMNLYPAYTKNSTFAGNITVESNNIPIEFGANGGKVIFSGSATQTLSKIGSYSPTFKKIQVNKSSGFVDLASPVTISDSLQLTKGIITTDTINFITLFDNSILADGSDTAYIHGPLKKIGNDAFTFALGDTAIQLGPYHPIGISAVSSSTDIVQAQYFPIGDSLPNNLDSVSVSTCEKWSLKHLGSSLFTVSLGWNQSSCEINDTSTIVVVSHNDTIWTDHDKNSIFSNGSSGIVTSIDSVFIPSGSSKVVTIGNKYGNSCLTSIQIPVDSSFTQINSDFNSTWISFIASSNQMRIILKNDSTPYLLQTKLLKLYSGNCDSLELLAIADTSNISNDTLIIDKDSLIIGETYFLQTINNCNLCNVRGSVYSIIVYAIQPCTYTSNPCNMITNPSFELGPTASGCNLLPNATGWLRSTTPLPCNTWYSNTPDLFDINALFGSCNRIDPGNFFGYEPERNGLCRYARISGGPAGETFIGSVNNTFYENLTYEISFYLSIPDYLVHSNGMVEVDLLHHGSCSTLKPIILTPAVPIVYTTGWHQYSNVFTLSSSEIANLYNRIQVGCSTTFDVFLDDFDLKPIGVNLGPDHNICIGTAITLNATLYGTLPAGYTYTWSSNPIDPTLTNIHNPSPIVSPTQTTTYTLVITDGVNGCSIQNDNIIITVSTTLPLVNAGTDVGICIGSSTNLGASGAASYEWSPTTALTCSTCANPTANPSSTITYTVIGTGANGCTNSDQVTVTVNSLPSVDAGLGVSICNGSSTNLGASGADSYVWSPTTALTCSTCANPIANPSVTISYTVTGTDVNGCTNSDQVTVTVLSSPSANAGIDQTICNGSSVTITASGGGAYSWNTGATTASISVSPISTTTYTVTVTNGNGCSSSDQVVVNVETIYPDPPEVTGPKALCSPNLTDLYTIDNFVQQDYTVVVWQIIAGVPTYQTAFTCSTSTFTYTWPFYSNDGYFVISTEGVCESSSTFYVYHCCDSDPLISNAWNNERASNVAPGGYVDLSNLSNGGQLKINGIFLVDENLTIYSPTPDIIEMGSGSEIIVLAGYRLTITNCILQAINCPPKTMWKGISLHKGTNFYMNSSIIYDAENAIEAYDGSSYFLTDSRFERNYNGIKIPLVQSNVYSSVNSSILNTRFKGSAPLIDKYVDQIEHDVKPNAGIVAYNTSYLSVRYANQTTPYIFFDHLNYGVIAINSNADIDNCEFTNIKRTNSTNYNGLPSSGVGVYVQSTPSLVSVKGTNTNYATFTNCDYGVYVNSGSALVYRNLMNNVGTGVHIRNCVIGQHTTVSSNLINNCFYGINCSFNLVAAITINDFNIINVGYSSGRGIRIMENGFLNNYKIYDNEIYLNNGRMGIEAHNLRNSYIVANKIVLGSINEFGINLMGAQTNWGNTIQCNTIFSANLATTGFFGTTGIRNVLSQSNDILCNKLEYSDNGMLFAGINLNTTIAGNNINDHRFGINLLSTRVDPQGTPFISNGNSWKYNPYPGINSGLNAVNVIPAFNTFYIPNTICNPVPRYYVTDNTGISVFTLFSGGCIDIYDCSSNVTCTAPLAALAPRSFNLNIGDTLTAMDSLNFSDENYGPMRWESQKQLFAKLKADASLRTDSLFINFFDSVETTAIGNFGIIEDSMVNMNNGDSSYVSSKYLSDSLILIEIQKINYNDSLISLTTDTTMIDSLNNINSISDSVIAIYSNINDSLINRIKSGNNEKLDLGFEIANGISADSTFDQYLKYTYEVYLSTVCRGIFSLDSIQGAEIYSIASLCPNSGGEAVLLARSLYSLVNDTIVYPDTCLSDVTDTCTSPAQPGPISGPTSGQCGQLGVGYSITPVSGALSYTWFTNDTLISEISGLNNITSTLVDFVSSVSFESTIISVTANNNCGSGPSSKIVVTGKPNALDTIIGDNSVCSGSVKTYSISGSTGATEYNWEFPSDAWVISGSGSASVTVIWGSSSGNIQVNASNSCGESTNYSMPVTVNSCRMKSTNNTGTQIVAFPNPTKGKLTINIQSDLLQGMDLHVKDLSGRILMQEKNQLDIGFNSRDLDMSTFAKGIYFLNVSSSTFNETIRIIVE